MTSLQSYWSLLSTYIRPQRARFGLLALLLLGGIGLQVVNPQIMRYFIDTALNSGALESLLLAAGAFLVIALLQQGVSIGVTYLGENVAWTATNALRAELAWHCLNLDMDFHNEHTPGELIERIDGDLSEMAVFFSQFVVGLAGNLLLLAGILLVLFREDWRVGLVFLGFAALAVLLLNRLRGIAMPEEKARRQAEADLFGFIEEQLTGTEDIRSSGAVDFSLAKLIRLQANILRHNRRARKKEWIVEALVLGLLALGMVLLITTGAWLFTAGWITIGTVYLLITYMAQIENPIWNMTRQIENFQTIGACVERLGELRQLRTAQPGGPPPNPTSQATDPHEHRAEDALTVTLEHVSFAYQANEPVLRDISLCLAPGKVLGLLGRTGSGKTTLTRLLMRLYEPGAGRILLDGQDAREMDLATLRRHVGVVTQEVQLFRASVRDNLTFFDGSIPDAHLLRALHELELGDWLQALPNGLDTLLEAGGHSLSAGEGQLLAFARIFLRQPGLIILDEASSRLDPATETRIEHAINRLLRGRTAIIVAHRLGTLQRSDDILILEDGQTLEYGARARLESDPSSRFSRLLQSGLEEVLV